MSVEHLKKRKKKEEQIEYFASDFFKIACLNCKINALF